MSAPQLRMIGSDEPEPAQGWDRVIAAWRVGHSIHTTRAYTLDLEALRAELGAQDVASAMAMLCAGGPGEAALILSEWMASQEDGGAAPASIRRRVSSVRSLLKLGRAFGVIEWSEVVLRLPPVGLKQDRWTPSPEEVREALLALAQDESWSGRRNYALVRLLADLGLRVGSVIGCDLADLDLAARTVTVHLKGRGERIKTKTLPDPTADALEAWVAARGVQDGPLFLGANSGERMWPYKAYCAVKSAGLRHPHALRRYAITQAIVWANENGMSVLDVMEFSDHTNPLMLKVYYDAVTDTCGTFARAVAEKTGGK
jgi:integrase